MAQAYEFIVGETGGPWPFVFKKNGVAQDVSAATDLTLLLRTPTDKLKTKTTGIAIGGSALGGYQVTWATGELDTPDAKTKCWRAQAVFEIAGGTVYSDEFDLHIGPALGPRPV